MIRGQRRSLIALSLLGLCVAFVLSFLEWPVNYLNGFTELHMWFAGFRGHMITVDGYRVHYIVDGPAAGPPVVLIHGLGSRAQAWRNLAPYFARAGDRVYMPDLIGYGESQKPKNFSYSVKDEATIVIGFMHDLGLKRVDLGGWSMGGWVAQLIAGKDPQQFKRLMIFDSAGLYDRPTWNPALFTPTTPAQLNQLNRLLRPNPAPIPGFVARDILRISQKDAWVIHRALASMFTGRYVTNKLLPKLRMPVFLAWGADDQCLPLSEGERMHKLIPQSQLEVVPGCGHLAPLDCANKIGPQAVAFLKSNPPRQHQLPKSAAH